MRQSKRSRWHRPAVLALALLLDLKAGDPPDAVHPVARFGRVACLWERDKPRGRAAAFLCGAAGAAVLPLGAALFYGGAVRRLSGPVRLLAEAVLLKSTFSLRDLLAAGEGVQTSLQAGDLLMARERLRGLVSREVGSLDEGQIAGAAIESLAENAVDSFLSPWCYYALAGLPAAAAYRAVNTLDAMWGYRTAEYEWFGKTAARLDDGLNYLPATLGARLLLLAGQLQILNVAAGRRLLQRDGASTASPNAGRSMSATAGLLAVRLEKPGAYVLAAEYRAPVAADIGRARTLVLTAALLGFGAAVLPALLRGGK